MRPPFDLDAHQVYVLKLLAQPADRQLHGGFLYDDDPVPCGLCSFWQDAFTGWLQVPCHTNLLPGFEEDIAEIDARLRPDDEQLATLWADEAVATDPFWEALRQMARAALARRGFTDASPDPQGWFLALPEHLH